MIILFFRLGSIISNKSFKNWELEIIYFSVVIPADIKQCMKEPLVNSVLNNSSYLFKGLMLEPFRPPRCEN